MNIVNKYMQVTSMNIFNTQMLTGGYSIIISKHMDIRRRPYTWTLVHAIISFKFKEHD